jgi:hypothetical protein
MRVRPLLLLLGASALGGGACTRVIDAVVPVECGQGSIDPSCAPTGWPVSGHGANSDPWIATHNDVITVMRPRVLVLNFANAQSSDATTQTAKNQIAAIAEGSRYHGYSVASAPAFLQYEIAKVVDLTDQPPPSGWTNPSSTRLPTAPTGEFDPLALFSAEFADLYGFPDPVSPPRALSLCELFEKGMVNEVWIQDGEAGVRRAPLYLERKQIYDAAGGKVDGSFLPCVGSGCLNDILCGVTVRLAHLDPARGQGCDLEVRGWGIEGMWDALPAFQPDAAAFLNHDFDKRFGVLFTGWADICDKTGTPCVAYPTPTSANGHYADNSTWMIKSFQQGCGATQFPPNATLRGDVANRSVTVDSRCAHFGLGDGPSGGDAYDPYTADTVAAQDLAFPDCGGGWQVFWRQSIPGLGNPAKRADGSPMHNWWPVLFY